MPNGTKFNLSLPKEAVSNIDCVGNLAASNNADNHANGAYFMQSAIHKDESDESESSGINMMWAIGFRCPIIGKACSITSVEKSVLMKMSAIPEQEYIWAKHLHVTVSCDVPSYIKCSLKSHVVSLNRNSDSKVFNSQMIQESQDGNLDSKIRAERFQESNTPWCPEVRPAAVLPLLMDVECKSCAEVTGTNSSSDVVRYQMHEGTSCFWRRQCDLGSSPRSIEEKSYDKASDEKVILEDLGTSEKVLSFLWFLIVGQGYLGLPGNVHGPGNHLNNDEDKVS
ncbi:hypothetical protein NC651_029431 [Populus alba x Populus x berolinensis]|nr:hypothetical protein NC651_029431 [Populus alba x Populus x berolinensis]